MTKARRKSDPRAWLCSVCGGNWGRDGRCTGCGTFKPHDYYVAGQVEIPYHQNPERQYRPKEPKRRNPITGDDVR